MSFLEIKNVSHRYDQNILSDISLNIKKGEIICLLGPSGCGKSTLLKLIAGIEPIQLGSIVLNDKIIASMEKSLPPEIRHVGMVFQHSSLFPHLTVEENILFGVKKSVSMKAIMHDYLIAISMQNHASHYPHMLSGGEQQRVALARALIRNPSLLLLDEPFSSLDHDLRKKMRCEMRILLKKHHISTLMVTHDAEEAMECADRIYVIYEGKILQEGKASSLYYTPCNSWVAGFFGSINITHACVTAGKIQSPFGMLDAKNFAENTKVTLVIREEALQLSDTIQENTLKGRVESDRFLGQYSVVTFYSEAYNLFWRMRYPSCKNAFLEGSIIYITCDVSHIYIFSS